jgi:hypothetical protein
MVEIDHGNGLASRYAHTSQVFVKEGDLVVRGQRVATRGFDRPLDRTAPAFRSSAERHPAKIPRGFCSPRIDVQGGPRAARRAAEV